MKTLTRKKLSRLLACAAILFPLTGSAQPQNIIDSGDVWQDAHILVDPISGQTQRIDYYFMAGEDTIFNGFKYYKLLYSGSVYDYQNPEIEWSFFEFIRQDTSLRRLYVYTGNPQNPEELWYDFNATVGDSINEEAIKTRTNPPVVVGSDTIEVPFSDSIRVLVTEEPGYDNCNRETLELYDGIGSNFGFNNFVQLPFGSIDQFCLVCYAKKDRMVYSGSSDFQFCDKITSIQEHSKNSDLSYNIYPNPVAEGQKRLSIEGVFLKQSDIVIINALGEILYQSKIQGNNPKINLPKLQAGLYYLKIGNSLASRFVVY